VLALAAVALSTAGCGKAQEGVPNALVGRWVSDDPHYASRSFTVDAGTISFETGESLAELHTIDGVDTRDDAGTVVHTVRYRDADGSVASLTIEIVPGARPALRFENHDELWIRDYGRR